MVKKTNMYNNFCLFFIVYETAKFEACLTEIIRFAILCDGCNKFVIKEKTFVKTNLSFLINRRNDEL